MAQREFFDFVDVHGVNVIKAWVQQEANPTLRQQKRAKLTERVAHIRVAPIVRKEYMEKLHSPKCQALYELKIYVGNIQHRILSAYGPGSGQITMLFPAIEHNNKLTPKNACTIALNRMAEWHLPGRVIEHGTDY